MAFSPKTWQNDPSHVTPISAEALIDLETRLAQYTDDQIDSLPSGGGGGVGGDVTEGDLTGTWPDIGFAVPMATAQDVADHTSATMGIHGIPNGLTAGQSVRRNTANDAWEAITPATQDDIDSIVSAGAPDASTTQKGISKLSVAPASTTQPVTVGDNDGRVPTQSENDALQGNSGHTPATGNRYLLTSERGTTNGVAALGATVGSIPPRVTPTQLPPFGTGGTLLEWFGHSVPAANTIPEEGYVDHLATGLGFTRRNNFAWGGSAEHSPGNGGYAWVCNQLKRPGMAGGPIAVQQADTDLNSFIIKRVFVGQEVFDTTGLYVGAIVTGPNIPANTYITAIGTNQVTLNNKPTTTTNGTTPTTLSFTTRGLMYAPRSQLVGFDYGLVSLPSLGNGSNSVGSGPSISALRVMIAHTNAAAVISTGDSGGTGSSWSFGSSFSAVSPADPTQYTDGIAWKCAGGSAHATSANALATLTLPSNYPANRSVGIFLGLTAGNYTQTWQVKVGSGTTQNFTIDAGTVTDPGIPTTVDGVTTVTDAKNNGYVLLLDPSQTANSDLQSGPPTTITVRAYSTSDATKPFVIEKATISADPADGPLVIVPKIPKTPDYTYANGNTHGPSYQRNTSPASTILNDNVLRNLNYADKPQIGWGVSGAGIPVGSTITAIARTTSTQTLNVTISNNATATATLDGGSGHPAAPVWTPTDPMTNASVDQWNTDRDKLTSSTYDLAQGGRLGFPERVITPDYGAALTTSGSNGNPKYFLPDKVHPNAEGHGVIVNVLRDSTTSASRLTSRMLSRAVISPEPFFYSVGMGPTFPVFENSWSVMGSGTAPPSYHRHLDGRVELRGGVTGIVRQGTLSTTTNPTVITGIDTTGLVPGMKITSFAGTPVPGSSPYSPPISINPVYAKIVSIGANTVTMDKNATLSTTTAISFLPINGQVFTLPQGFRPKYTKYISVSGISTTTIVKVDTNGAVTINSPPFGVPVSESYVGGWFNVLDGVNFAAAQ
jgi:hypothetical protein